MPQTMTLDSQARRPFELVRYFTVTSLVIILLFTLVISSLVGMRTSDLVLQKKEQYAQLLLEHLNHQIMLRYVRPLIDTYRIVSADERRQLLQSVVENSIHSFQVKRVNIIDLQGNIIYSTSPEYIGRVVKESDAFLKAASGHSVSYLDPPRGFYDFGPDEKRVFKILSPMRDERLATSELGEPRAVFEITLDINEDFKDVWVSQLLLVAALLLLMAFLFFILRSIVNRGYRIMDKRAMELRLLEGQLNQNERLAALGRMVAGVAHEIRNPLGIVRSTAELLGSRAEAGQKKLAQVIVEESSRLNQVVSEFLDFARPQKANLRSAPLGQSLRRLLEFMQSQLDEERVMVRLHEQTPLNSPMMQDPEQLYRVFMNIMANAMQAMSGQEERVVDITVQKTSLGGRAWIDLIFDDNGPGFPPGYNARSFEPFYTTKENGTGLGLAIVKAIVESHGGRIQLSASPDGGGRVSISLPAMK